MNYHYILTMAVGPNQIGKSGTVTVRPGATRQAIYENLVETVLRSAADRGLRTTISATLFFALEPDTLGGAR